MRADELAHVFCCRMPVTVDGGRCAPRHRCAVSSTRLPEPNEQPVTIEHGGLPGTSNGHITLLARDG